MKQAAVCIIENRHGQILLLQRENIPHGFGLPGGKMEAHESIVQCVVREIREETGIDIEILHDSDFLGTVQSAREEYQVHVFYKHEPFTDSVKPYTSSFDLAKSCVFDKHGPPVTLSDEHVGYIWTVVPEEGIDLAGNTYKMLALWRTLLDERKKKI